MPFRHVRSKLRSWLFLGQLQTTSKLSPLQLTCERVDNNSRISEPSNKRRVPHALLSLWAKNPLRGYPIKRRDGRSHSCEHAAAQSFRLNDLHPGDFFSFLPWTPAPLHQLGAANFAGLCGVTCAPCLAPIGFGRRIIVFHGDPFCQSWLSSCSRVCAADGAPWLFSVSFSFSSVGMVALTKPPFGVTSAEVAINCLDSIPYITQPIRVLIAAPMNFGVMEFHVFFSGFPPIFDRSSSSSFATMQSANLSCFPHLSNLI